MTDRKKWKLEEKKVDNYLVQKQCIFLIYFLALSIHTPDWPGAFPLPAANFLYPFERNWSPAVWKPKLRNGSWLSVIHPSAPFSEAGSTSILSSFIAEGPWLGIGEDSFTSCFTKVGWWRWRRFRKGRFWGLQLWVRSITYGSANKFGFFYKGGLHFHALLGVAQNEQPGEKETFKSQCNVMNFGGILVQAVVSAHYGILQFCRIYSAILIYEQRSKTDTVGQFI